MNTEKALKQLNELKKYTNNLRLAAESWDRPWKILISTILSARTRDEKTIAVCNVLFRKYKGAKDLAKANINDVQKIINPVNYYKTKSKNIIQCAKTLVEKYNGNPPHDFNKLIELVGVGRKTANVFLSEIGRSTIAVDTHVAFLSQKLGWSKHDKPEKIEVDLKKLFPKAYWRKVNPTLVRFGRSYSKKNKEEILVKIKQIK